MKSGGSPQPAAATNTSALAKSRVDVVVPIALATVLAIARAVARGSWKIKAFNSNTALTPDHLTRAVDASWEAPRARTSRGSTATNAGDRAPWAAANADGRDPSPLDVGAGAARERPSPRPRAGTAVAPPPWGVERDLAHVTA